MIEGFGTLIQHDGIQVAKYLAGNDMQEQKVYLSGVRVLSALGMVIGGLITISAIPTFFANPVGAVIIAAAGAAIYAASHDVFVMAKNQTVQEANKYQKGKAGVMGFVKDVIDLANGQKDLDDAPRNPITEGTFFRPLWDTTNLPQLIVKA